MDPGTFSIVLGFALAALGLVVGLVAIHFERRPKTKQARSSR
jgi:hypothetical protein